MSAYWSGRALEIACWGACVAMLVLNFGARTGGEIEREQGIKAFVEARAEGHSPYPDFVTPDSPDWPDSESPVRVASQPALASQEKLYCVTEVSIVEPGDTTSMSATETAAVTLVTCHPFYFVGHAPQRYIARAVALQ